MTSHNDTSLSNRTYHFCPQEDKKKRDKDRGESEGERDLKGQNTIRLELPPEKPLASSLAKQEGKKILFKCIFNIKWVYLLHLYLVRSLLIR